MGTPHLPAEAFASVRFPLGAPRKTMKPNRLHTPLPSTLLLGLFLGPVSLAAQSLPGGNSAVATPETEKAIELSPFVVQSDKDTGYQAASTLAGTRLNTPVKDLGAAISIYTKDFLDRHWRDQLRRPAGLRHRDGGGGPGR
jgi:hypothetical protein